MSTDWSKVTLAEIPTSQEELDALADRVRDGDLDALDWLVFGYQKREAIGRGEKHLKALELEVNGTAGGRARKSERKERLKRLAVFVEDLLDINPGHANKSDNSLAAVIAKKTDEFGTAETVRQYLYQIRNPKKETGKMSVSEYLERKEK